MQTPSHTADDGTGNELIPRMLRRTNNQKMVLRQRTFQHYHGLVKYDEEHKRAMVYGMCDERMAGMPNREDRRKSTYTIAAGQRKGARLHPKADMRGVKRK